MPGEKERNYDQQTCEHKRPDQNMNFVDSYDRHWQDSFLGERLSAGTAGAGVNVETG